jgi:hypothetical protein
MGATNAGKEGEELARVTVPAEALEPAIARAEVLEQVIVPAVVQELATDPEGLEQVIGLVQVRVLAIVLAAVQALVIVLAAVREPVSGQAEAVPEHDPVAVALRTKSVTAAHRRDLVPLLAAEVDLVAAVAEIMREPAAAEAATAWAAEE